ncbi:tRNA1(Val) (adenine(37)-N6)-methyltransferase [Mycoplasma sp. P36-A1]|uniref:tRNA1(Val) (adenine(37)-N6)-methyltransferase n=1 Tax=Mycoplasma sp. P36-A1 TaxID=3252900 RepID=UPI003C2E579F
MVEVENYLLENKKLKIIQRKDMFNFSLDSVLLSHFVFISKKNKTIVDFGTNNAAIPLMLSTMTNQKIIAVEIQKEAVDLANKNIVLNNLEEQVEVVHSDIKDFVKNLNIKVGTVVCNPPFFKVKECSNVNENEFLQIARHEIKITLEQIIASAAKILENNGRFAMIHRPDRMIEIIELMKKYKIEPKRIQFIYPRINQQANMILIEGRFQGNAGGLIIEKPIYAHNEDGSYTEQVKEMFLGDKNEKI